MKSLRLIKNWNPALDPSGNLTTVTATERVAQAVACYERVFKGELWYGKDEGVPYWMREMGTLPQNELVIARANARALEVPGAATAETTLNALTDRELTGDIRVTTENGEVINVSV